MKISPIISRTMTAATCCFLGACNFAAKPVNVVAYVANAGSNNVQMLDTKSGETINKLYTGAAPWRLLLAPDGKHLIVQHWYAETSAVVNLSNNKIEKILPVRGPAVFTPKGDALWSHSWPAAPLISFDAKTFAQVKKQGGEEKTVYDMAIWGDQIAKGQYDPVTKSGRKVFDNVLTSKLDDPKAIPAQTPSGTSPAKLVVDPSGDFLLTANFDDKNVSIINKLGDGRSITLAANPRDIVFNKNGKQMIVIAWARGSLSSDIFTLDTDFKQRPWPAINAHSAKHLRAGLTDAEMGPDGLLYVLDRPGKRLLVLNPDSLEEIKSIPVGDDPMAFVLRQVSNDERAQIAQKSESRKQLEEILTKMRDKIAPFKDVSFTESLVQPLPDDTKTDGKDQSKKKAGAQPKTFTTDTKTQIRLPDSVNQQLANGAVRLGQGGQAMLIIKGAKGSSYNVSPRQELMHVLYVLNALPVDEAIRQLAGDVPGSVFLRNGIAVDIVNTVEEDGHKFYSIGASARGEPVSQLWINAETGLPVDLVEQYPIIRTKNPHEESAGFQGLTETKVHYHEVDGRQFPVELTRYLDGVEVGVAKISNIAFDKNLPAESFSLALLGNVVKPYDSQPTLEKGEQSGPGLAVVSQGTSHVSSTYELHQAYNSNPATSGPHTHYAADPGVHKIPVPPELQVGSLINGAVLLQYACPQACPELVQQLEGIAQKHEEVVVAPYPLMKNKIALTAWQRLDAFDEFDEKRINVFIEAYAGKPHPHEAQDLPEAVDGSGTMAMPPGHPSMPSGPAGGSAMPHSM